jgi:hypothetical protein
VRELRFDEVKVLERRDYLSRNFHVFEFFYFDDTNLFNFVTRISNQPSYPFGVIENIKTADVE